MSLRAALLSELRHNEFNGSVEIEFAIRAAERLISQAIEAARAEERSEILKLIQAAIDRYDARQARMYRDFSDADKSNALECIADDIRSRGTREDCATPEPKDSGGER
jgi:hypothetical protein